MIGDEAGGVRACLHALQGGGHQAGGQRRRGGDQEGLGLAARDLAGALADLPHAGQRPLHVLVQQESLLGGVTRGPLRENRA